MNLTETILKKLVPTGKDLGRFVGPLNETMERYEIDRTLNRAAMFLCQILHESGGLKYTKELWGPTPSQRRYEYRADLGNTQEGDGFRYRGRGILQTTGRANYAAVSKALGQDFIANPELLEQPYWATLSAGHFWASHKLNELADTGDVRKVTRVINGGYNGLHERELYYNKAKIYLAPLFTENVLSWKPGENIG